MANRAARKIPRARTARRLKAHIKSLHPPVTTILKPGGGSKRKAQQRERRARLQAKAASIEAVFKSGAVSAADADAVMADAAAGKK
jgi:hypothetical protein